MVRLTRLMALATALTVAGAGLAEAHTGVGGTGGMIHGFLHPIGGLDHILAMVAVGLFAAQLGGRALWAVPAAFVAMMAAGGILGLEGVQLPFVELGIALSVIVIGGAVALSASLPLAAAMGLAGFFAIFHGHAHGAEMPADASGLAYGLGFMAATAALHGLGLALGLGVSHVAGGRGAMLPRFAGAAMALAGLGLLTGTV